MVRLSATVRGRGHTATDTVAPTDRPGCQDPAARRPRACAGPRPPGKIGPCERSIEEARGLAVEISNAPDEVAELGAEIARLYKERRVVVLGMLNVEAMVAGSQRLALLDCLTWHP